MKAEEAKMKEAEEQKKQIEEKMKRMKGDLQGQYNYSIDFKAFNQLLIFIYSKFKKTQLSKRPKKQQQKKRKQLKAMGTKMKTKNMAQRMDRKGVFIKSHIILQKRRWKIV